MIHECFKYIIEVLFAIGWIVNALLFIPQGIKLYKTKNTEGMSKIMFVGFNIFQIISIIRSYLVNDYVALFGFASVLITSGAVTFMIFYYEKNKRV